MPKKYSNKFKIKVVKERQDGASYIELKRKYGIGGDHTIQKWENRFATGLLTKNENKYSYSTEFKNKVISEVMDRSDINQVSIKYGLDYNMVLNWYEHGEFKKEPLVKSIGMDIDDVFVTDVTEINTAEEISKRNKDRERKLLKAKLDRALTEIETLREETKIVSTLEKNFSPKIIKSSPNIIKGSESAIILQWSDWHIEEVVHYHAVNGLNEFNLTIAEQRINRLIKDTVRIIDMVRSPYKSKKIIIHLGGDFITGDIHEELSESNSLLPTDAIIEVQNKIAGALDYIMSVCDLPIEIVSSTGNHGRMTKQQRISTELGHSLEQYMYYVLQQKYKDNKQIKFHPQRSYHTILDIYGTITRFHHGHFMRYSGGVGGPTIPINKAIAQWNKSIRADLDVFGHFHQSMVGKYFILNGCLIGFNSYAISIKAEYEPPSQNLFLIDSRRGRTLYTPIMLDEK